MTELGLTYTAVNVPARREERAELIALSDQATVPVLQDGERLVIGSDDIIEYLRTNFPAPADAEDHQALSVYRNAVSSPLDPASALARLKQLLGENDLEVFAEVEGGLISPRLPAGYALLEAGVPAAAAKAFAVDAAAAAAIAVPFVVYPVEDGTVVAAADPVGLVWLLGVPPLNKLQRSVRERVDAVFAQF